MGCTFGKTGIGIVRGAKLILELRKMLDPSKVKLLNDEGDEAEVTSNPKDIVELSKQLHKQVLKLKGDFLQDDGTVQYSKMRESTDYQAFKKDCSKLKLVDLASLNATENKAFFINLYNSLTVHALAENVTDEKSVLQLEKFWQMYAYKIGEFVFSLDDMEHGVLRCNKLHPTYKDYFFKEGDPRRNFVQEELDPRIHFALNCGAKSCPPIRLFSAENLDNALDLASKNFCQNDITIDVTKKTVTASKILMWYGSDFGPDKKSILERIFPYFNSTQQNLRKFAKGIFL